MNKLSKLAGIIKAIPKRTAAIILTLIAVLVPAVIFAAGSTRPENLDITKPVDYITFNQYVNNNGLWNKNNQDEHDFMKVGPTTITSTSQLTENVVAQEGKEYYVYMYVHNNAKSSLNLIAKNVRVRIASIDTTAGTTQQLRGFINADNCGAKQDGKGGQTPGSACTFWDEAGFQSADGRKFTMEYVAGSAIYMVTHSGGTFKLSDSIVTATGNNGVLLGYTSLNGQIPGCAEYSGYVVIRVKPKYQTPKYDVEKKVNGATSNTVKPGDTMTYTLTARNTGNVDLTNVKINDTLPAYYQSASETLPAGATGSIINAPHTVTIPKLAVGATATITISYKVKGESAFECDKTTTFTNRVTSSTDQTSTEDNLNNNQTTTNVTYPCTPPPPQNPNFDLVKTVDKTAARPGDTLNYTLTFRNTGDVDLTNVVIKDTLPAGLTVTGNINASATNASTPTNLANLFTSGATAANVKVGGVVTITFAVKVNSDAVPAVNCGENKKDFVNRSSATTAEKPNEPNTTNNSTTTTVTVIKDCNYSYDLIKTGPATAKPGETVTYTLTFKNTGDQPLTNVVVKDVLPSGVTYVAGSTTVQRSTNSPQPAADGVTTSAGLNIGTVNPASAVQQPGSETGVVVIRFQAKMPNTNKLICGDNRLTNNSSAVTKEKQTEDSTTNNSVTTVVTNDCKANYDVIKTVDKATAQPGDTLIYTITVKNTGQTDITNVIVKDTLPNYITSAQATTVAPSTASGNLFKEGVTIAKLQPGETATITVTAVIKAADQLPCGATVLVNRVTSSTDQTKNEDNLDNNTAKTTVNRECQPPVTPPVTPPTTPSAPVTPGTPSYTPSTIVATGPTEAAAAILGTGALTFGGMAYLRSRKDLLSKLLNK